MDIGSAVTAYNGLKSVKEIFSSIRELRNDTEILERLNEAANYVGAAQDTIFELRDNLSKLQEENSNLQRAIKSGENWSQRIQDYNLVDTDGGAVVYKYNNNPEHYICTNCIESKEIQILQDRKVISGIHYCPKCKMQFNINQRESINIEPTTGSHLLR